MSDEHWLQKYLIDCYGRPTIQNPKFWSNEFEHLKKKLPPRQRGDREWREQLVCLERYAMELAISNLQKAKELEEWKKNFSSNDLQKNSPESSIQNTQLAPTGLLGSSEES